MILFEKIQLLLKVWLKLSTHTRMRDRSIKVLQYGCQMLLGIYGTQFSHSTLEYLKLLRATASTSRKAFWLLKSLNHVESLVNLIQCYNITDNKLVCISDILEQLFLIIYYLYENLVFLCRVKLINITENSINGWGNMSWFLEDLFGFTSLLLRMHSKSSRIKEMKKRMLTMNKCCDICDGVSNLITDIGNSKNTTYTDNVTCDECKTIYKNFDITVNQIQLLKKELNELFLGFTIATLELSASAEAVRLWKGLFGVSLGDTGMGLCGVTSSILILYQFSINVYIDLLIPHQEPSSNNLGAESFTSFS